MIAFHPVAVASAFVHFVGAYAQIAPRPLARSLSGAPVGIATITDVAVDSKGRIYIADDSLRTIHITDGHLRPIAATGGFGTGEGQFRALQAVRVIDANAFVAIDRILRRLYVYRWQAGTPVLVRTVALPFQPFDVCPISRSRFLIAGLYGMKRLHVIDDAGKVVASVAPFEAGTLMGIALPFSQGSVGCARNGRDVILTSRWTPDVEVFEQPSMRLVEKTILSPTERVSVRVLENGEGVHFEFPERGFYSPGRATQDRNGWLIGVHSFHRVDVPDSVAWFRYRRGDVHARLIGISEVLFPFRADSAIRVTRNPTSLRIVHLKSALRPVGQAQ